MPIRIPDRTKYHLITFGCQMNKSDSERIAGVLEKIGYRATNKLSLVDLIVINMCSVRQSAVDRVFSKIGDLAKLKIKNAKCKIILTGCILKKDYHKLKNKVDLIFNIRDLPKLPSLLKLAKSKNEFANYLSLSPLHASISSAYVPIMTGCNNFCAYCVVPYTRGREISRPAEEIINEIKYLVKKGYKEIILLGQNVNSYKGTIKNQKSPPTQTEKIKNKKSKNLKIEKSIDFADLLRLIDNLPGDFRLTFITSHPKDLSDKLIKTMSSGKKIMPYLHLPVQSGDNEILKKMNRGYTVENYKKIIRRIRKKIPGLSLSTDIIVGFPGETKKQFENTAKLMKQIEFDMVYIARYSPRLGTAAANFADNVSQKEKKSREKILTEILVKTASKKNRKYLKKTVEVLIEKNPRENKSSAGRTKNEFCLGKTKTFKTVRIKSSSLSLNQITKVKIVKIGPWGLEGIISR